MKPEYNHGQYNTFHVRLYSSNVGDKPQAVLQVLSRHNPRFTKTPLAKFLPFLEFPHLKLFDKTISSKNEAYYIRLKDEFEQAGALPEINISTTYYPIAETTLDKHLSLVPRTYKRTKKQTIAEFYTLHNEYALDLWAQANGIGEAYRIFVNHSRGHESLIRLWWHNSSAYGKRIQPELESETQMLDIKGVSGLKEWMHENFWAVDSWYNPLPYEEIAGVQVQTTIMDGAEFLVEGWKDGQYKLLFAPTQTASTKGYEAHDLLRHIIK